MSYSKSVFINAPFDRKFQKLFYAIVFTITDCGFEVRCALEVDNGAEARLSRIYSIIGDCMLAVHDLSRTQLDPVHRLPRFNMPLELGIFLGAKRFGKGRQSQKNCLILDTERFRYQKFISDIAGQDPRAHGDDPDRAISAVRDWLLHQRREVDVPSARHISQRYETFKSELPRLCRKKNWDRQRLTFKERLSLTAQWINSTPLG